MQRFLTIKEFCEYAGIGKTKAYELASRTDLRIAIRIGRKILIDKASFDELIIKCERYNIRL